MPFTKNVDAALLFTLKRGVCNSEAQNTGDLKKCYCTQSFLIHILTTIFLQKPMAFSYITALGTIAHIQREI
jgi:hypothetical protein